jgi:hypothetical protein
MARIEIIIMTPPSDIPIIAATRSVSVGPVPVNPDDGRACGKIIATECILVIFGLSRRLSEKARRSNEIIKINMARIKLNIRRQRCLDALDFFS